MTTIKRMSKEDIDVFLDIARNAYPRMAIDTSENREKMKEKFLNMHQRDNGIDFYGLFRNETLYGGMLFHDFNINLFSFNTQAGGLGFVAVDFIHKKEKIAKDMIAYYLRHYRNRGISLVLLYPFRPDFYKKMGFGYGTKMNHYRIQPGSLLNGPSKGNISFVKGEEREELLRCYHEFFQNNHGMIEKRRHEVEGLFDNPKNRIVAYKKEDRIQGYIVFTFKEGRQDQFLINDLIISEFIYQNTEALLELLTFLHSQKDQIRYIILNTQEESFHYLLHDPRNGTENLIPHVYHESNTQGVGLMYRMVDIPGIFTAMKNHNFGGQSYSLKITVEDSFLVENQGSTVIDFKNGMATISSNEDYDVEIKLDISDFSSLFMGVVTIKTLYRYGRVLISNKDYLDKINKTFETETKPICTTPF